MHSKTPLSLAYAAKLLNLEYKKQNKGHDQDIYLSGVNHDTRTLKKGDLFVAIPGEKVNGHHFLKEAESKGAVAALISEAVETTLPTLKVENTVQALGQLAKGYRAQFQIPIAAITGSCGKTTVKEMLASILSCENSILATQGNLNTEIGLPLTLLSLKNEHQKAVIEMGARKKGDIRYLMELTQPSVSLITNAGMAHVEIFGSEQGIAEAKGEIYQYLDKDGIAILNQDSPFAPFWRTLIGERQILSFGLEKEADVTALYLIQEDSHSEFELQFKNDSVKIHLPVPGLHNIYNALAAAATALAMNVSPPSIQMGLKRFKPVSGRLQMKDGILGIKIIDDTYNANPVSMRAALQVLSQQRGKKIFVMGDMFELGVNSIRMHQDIGKEAKRLKCDALFGIGPETAHAVEAFGEGGMHFNDKAALINALKPILSKETTLLIKGSRGMRMEDIVHGLQESTRENTIC